MNWKFKVCFRTLYFMQELIETFQMFSVWNHGNLKNVLFLKSWEP